MEAAAVVRVSSDGVERCRTKENIILIWLANVAEGEFEQTGSSVHLA